jgi:quinol monooxygenase YgiN
VILITANFRVLPEHADGWVDITREFTEATRAERGNLFVATALAQWDGSAPR